MKFDTNVKEYKVVSIEQFDRQLKRLTKKFTSLKNEIEVLKSVLKKNPEYGSPLGNNCFKIRLAMKSKGKGKRGGARIITHFYIIKDTIILLSIYDKSEQANISDAEIQKLLNLL